METKNNRSLPSEVRNHYLDYGMYTDPGLYKQVLEENLPDSVRDIGLLVRKSLIHRTTLASGNHYTNSDFRFGDMTQVPWWRQPEDDVLQTAGAMLTELYRRDSRGFTFERAVENKLVLTCRYVAILMASILKSKGLPCRVRAGHAPYFDMGNLGNVSTDHWINQYWSDEGQRWVTIDTDGSLSMESKDLDPYDLPDGSFDFAADAWLAVREGRVNQKHFHNAGGFRGLLPVLWSLTYDFHSIMNCEIIYMHGIKFSRPAKFKKLTETELRKIDNLARLMQSPDENFEKLKEIWETDKDFRLLTGSLL